MVYHDCPYLDMLQYIMDDGLDKPNRTGMDARSIFSYQMRFDLSDGTIPLLTTKKMHLRSIIYEILWYLKGESNIKYLKDNGVTIWDEWADKNGELGPGTYGRLWRRWPSHEGEIDQIAKLIEKIGTNPNDRRLIVSAWNVALLDKTALPACHMMFQCWVGNGRLSLDMTQRSCDSFLGVPYNIVQYSILTRMIAEVVGLKPGEFIWNGKDVHIYANHFDQVGLQLSRKPFPSPILKFSRNITDIDDFKYEDFVIEGYKSHPTIKADVAV